MHQHRVHYNWPIALLVVLGPMVLGHSASAQIDFDALSTATVANDAIPSFEGRSMLMEAYHGKIYFATSVYGKNPPSQVLVYDPADGHSTGVNHSVLLSGTDRYSALATIGEKLFICTESGDVFVHDGTSTVELSDTPFHAGEFVHTMCEFGARAFFGTSAGTVYRLDPGGWILAFDSGLQAITSLTLWQGRLYGFASGYDAGDSVVFSTATGDVNDGDRCTVWTVAPVDASYYGNGVLVPSAEHLNLAGVDNGGGYFSTFRRSTDGIIFDVVYPSDGYKIPWDGISYEGYSYASYDIVGASSHTRIIWDDGQNTGAYDNDFMVMQIVTMNGHLYTAQLETTGGYSTPGFVRIMTNAPASCPGDLDHTGDVGVKDLLELLGNWGACVP